MKPMTKTTNPVFQLIWGFALFSVFLLISCSPEADQNGYTRPG